MHGRRGSNSQPSVLETDALPIELRPYAQLAASSRQLLFYNFYHLSCAHCSSAFTDSEAKTFVHRNRLNQFNLHGYVIARHYHFSSCRKSTGSCYVSCTHVKLRTIIVMERSMTTAFFFFQNINLSFENSMRSDGSRFSKNHSSPDIFFIYTAEQKTCVIACLS